MRIWFGALCALTAACGSAAADDGVYLSVSGSLVDVYDSIDADIGGADLELDLDTGFGAGAAIGYRMNWFRIELEGGYQKADIGEASLDGAEFDGLTFDAGNADGSGRIYSAMLNAYADIGSWRLKPFVGLGLGAAVVEIDRAQASVDVSAGGTPVESGTATIIDGSELAPAAQLMAGVGFDLTESLTLSLGYRAFIAGPVEYDVTLPIVGDVDEVEGAAFTQSAKLELRYVF